MNIIFNSKLKILISSIIIFIAILTVYYKRVSSIDVNSFTSSIITTIKNEFGSSVTIEKAYISVFPTPTLVITRINIDEGMFIDHATIDLSILSSIMHAPSYKKISVSDLYVNPNNINLADIKYHEAIIKLSSLPLSSIDLCISKLWDTALTNRLLAENLCIEKSNRQIQILSHFVENLRFQDKIKYLPDSNTWTSNIEIYNNNANININTIFSTTSLESGEFSGTIKNLALFTNEISTIGDFLMNNHIQSTESIELKGKIAKNEDQVFIEDIVIKGDNLDISGTYWFASNQEEIGTLSIKINTLKTENIFTGIARSHDDQEAIFSLQESKMRFVAESENVSIGKSIINNFKLDATGNGSSFKIDSCSGEIDGEGNFQISGSIESNKYRPKFLGHINLNHNNINDLIANALLQDHDNSLKTPLYIKSDLIATPIDFKMMNFKMMVGSETLSGNINLKLAGNTQLLIGDVEIDALNLQTTNFPVVKKAYEYVQSLALNMPDQNYATKYLVLRTFPIKAILDINFDGLYFSENTKFDRMSMLTSYDAGQLKIDNFLINMQDKLSISGNGRVFANSLKPQIKINISSGYIKVNDFSQNEFNDFIDFTTQNIDLSKLDLSSEGTLDNFEFNNIKISDLGWTSKNDGTILNIPKLTFTSFSGNVESSGSLSFNPLKLSFIFGIDGMDLSQMFSLSKKPLPITNGLLSVNGHLSATARDMSDLLYNLYIRGDFLSKNVTISGIDIDGAITKLSTLRLEPLIVDTVLNDSATSGETIFSKVSGSYEINSGIFSLKDISLMAETFAGSAGLAFNIYDESLDLNAIFSFYPLGAKINSPKITPPIKMKFAARGNLFEADKLLTFFSKDDIQRLIKFAGPQNNNANNK